MGEGWFSHVAEPPIETNVCVKIAPFARSE